MNAYPALELAARLEHAEFSSSIYRDLARFETEADDESLDSAYLFRCSALAMAEHASELRGQIMALGLGGGVN